MSSAISEVNGSLSRLTTTLDGRRRRFAAELESALGPGNMIPVEAILALQARQAAVEAEMRELVSTCGREVDATVGEYGRMLADCRRLLVDLGLGPAPLGIELEGSTVNGTTVPAPSGPFREVNPLPPPRAPEPGFVPAPGGPSILINEPALPGNIIDDGPGSGQLVPRLPGSDVVHADGPGTPQAAGEDYDPEFDFQGTGYSRDELEQFIAGHSDNRPGHQRPTADEIAGTLDQKPQEIENTNPDGSTYTAYQYDNVINGKRVRVFINPQDPPRSTTYYPG